MREERRPLMLILPAAKCPYCGAADVNAAGQKRLSPQSSRVVGKTRVRYVLCRDCGQSFKILFRLTWQSGARAEVIDDT